MTSKEFVMWMKGFTEAVHELGPSPANWQLIKDALAKVEDRAECKCNGKTYTYPYQGFTGTGEYITNDASKQILND
jgi:hypothetical protein